MARDGREARAYYWRYPGVRALLGGEYPDYAPWMELLRTDRLE
jgi:hypothetical protein